MKKPKDALSAKAHAKRAVVWKLSYLKPIKVVGSKGERHKNEKDKKRCIEDATVVKD